MIDKKTFKKALAQPLEEAGFIKKGQSWYLDGKDTIVVTNLEKCDWNETYFINIGIWMKTLGNADFPQYNHCHLYYRAESLFPEQRELILIGCNLEKTNKEILAYLSMFVQVLLVPFLRKCADEANLREYMRDGLLDDGLVRKEARQLLE
jgi:hypothetical protein